MRRVEHTLRHILWENIRARVDEAPEHRRTESLGCCSSTRCGSVTICCAWKTARPWSRNVTILVGEKWPRRLFHWTSNGLVDRRQRSSPSIRSARYILARIWNVRWTSLIYPWRERIPSIETNRGESRMEKHGIGTINSRLSAIS